MNESYRQFLVSHLASALIDTIEQVFHDDGNKDYTEDIIDDAIDMAASRYADIIDLDAYLPDLDEGLFDRFKNKKKSKLTPKEEELIASYRKMVSMNDDEDITEENLNSYALDHLSAIKNYNVHKLKKLLLGEV